MARQELLHRVEEFGRRLGITGVPPSTLLVVAGVCVAAVVFAFLRWSAGPADAEFSIDDAAAIHLDAQGIESDSVRGEETAEAGSVETSLVVHIAGAVHRPGLVRCAAGSRVGDAIAAAGGMLGNAAADSVNLARPLSDGEQIRVLTLDEVAAGTHQVAPGGLAAEGTGASGAGGGLVNLNTADVAALETLPGVGPATAVKIIADRDANGPFATTEDLMRVSGIGEKKFEAMADLVTVQ
ncbi:MAG: helix-hairpin-helix domain-containing protein [Coriobacteriia bacterium]|nr:helix-hairpin-helix domain-containing protein [Coriobacteriia bacterium]